MRLLISPAEGWKDVKSEVQEGFYFLVSNPPRKVNTTEPPGWALKESVAGMLTPLFTMCSNYRRQDHTQGRRHPEVALTPRVRPIALISLGHK